MKRYTKTFNKEGKRWERPLYLTASRSDEGVRSSATSFNILVGSLDRPADPCFPPSYETRTATHPEENQVV